MLAGEPVDDAVLMAVIRQVTNVVRKDGLPVEQG